MAPLASLVFMLHVRDPVEKGPCRIISPNIALNLASKLTRGGLQQQSAPPSFKAADSLCLIVSVQAEFGFNEHHQNETINYMRFARSKRILRLKTIDSCFEELKDSR